MTLEILSEIAHKYFLWPGISLRGQLCNKEFLTRGHPACLLDIKPKNSNKIAIVMGIESNFTSEQLKSKQPEILLFIFIK